MNILIFRTDRIGDFMISSILIKSIKRSYPNSMIQLVCSNKNYDYIKKYSLINNVYLHRKSSLTETFKLIKLLNKINFDYTFVIDGKKRSIFLSLFINSSYKIYTITKKIFMFLNFKNNNLVIFDNESEFNKIQILKKNLKLINCCIEDNDFNIFSNEIMASEFDLNKLKISEDNYVIFHLDEKWIYKEYIQSYTNIEPNINQFEKFIHILLEKTKKNLIITSGIKSNLLFNKLKSGYVKFNQNIYFMNYNKLKVILCENLNIFDLIFLISKSSLLITCHGAPSHIASSFNIKSIDIIDTSEYLLFNKYTSHLRNYNQISRKPFAKLCDEIISLS